VSCRVGLWRFCAAFALLAVVPARAAHAAEPGSSQQQLTVVFVRVDATLADAASVDGLEAQLGELSAKVVTAPPMRNLTLASHLSVWLTPDRTVTVRLQGATQLATMCSEDALALGQWVHVGFNFGAAGSELWVDHKLATRTGDPRIETVVPECGGTTPDGIAGNEQPWVLGFDTSRSGDVLDGLLQHFDGGALDALQISPVRRDFSKP
jgi:hypothetical protein